MQPKADARYDLTLLSLLVLITVVLGYSPHSRIDWALENLLVLLLVGTLVAASLWFRWIRRKTWRWRWPAPVSVCR